MCSIARQSSVVRIQPVIASFSDGKVIHEAGIGGGGEDLEREMELGVASTSDLHNLLEMCVLVIYRNRHSIFEADIFTELMH